MPVDTDTQRGYAIPKGIRYEEKFFLGLTGRQCLYFFVAGFIIYRIVLKTALPEEVKLFSSLAVAVVGFLMIIGYDRLIFDILHFGASPRLYKYGDRRLFQMLNVKDVRNDTIITNDGRYVAIVKVTPINLSIFKEEKQNAIIRAYKEFLNSIDFDVQILMRTVNIDMSEYFNNLKKTAKNQSYIADLENYFSTYMKEKDVRDREFFVVISYKPKTSITQKAVEERYDEIIFRLERRVKVVQDKLLEAGLVNERLNDNRLLTLLSLFYTEFGELPEKYLFPVTYVGG